MTRQKYKKGSDLAYRGMMFVAAVSLVVLIGAGFWGFYLMNRQIQISKNDAMIANLAGEQRLILSNFSFMFHTISKNPEFVMHESVRDQITGFLNTLQKNHALFMVGDPRHGVLVQHSEEMKEKLLREPLLFDRKFKDYLNDIHGVFDSDPS